MTQLTFYNLGNADCCRIDFRNTDRMLIDFADMKNHDDKNDNKSDLPKLLWEDLDDLGIDNYRVVAFSHLDNDHIKGSSAFFYFEHAEKYQGGKRARIDTLWVPATAITEKNVKDDAFVIRAEARHRLKEGKGIIVFSRPERLKEWLEENGLTIEERQHCFVDAGHLVPGFSLKDDCVEFFAHSPHAYRSDKNTIEDRNGDSLVFQTRFVEEGQYTDVLFTTDVDSEVLSEIVDITKKNMNHDRLHWNVYALPHHCSYKALNVDEKGEDKTAPIAQVKWLCEEQGEKFGYIVSTSNPIPAKGSQEDKDVQPPHRQAANYYKNDVVDKKRFLVTMEQPNSLIPKPIVIKIDSSGAVLKSAGSVSIAASVATTPPRAGAE